MKKTGKRWIAVLLTIVLAFPLIHVQKSSAFVNWNYAEKMKDGGTLCLFVGDGTPIYFSNLNNIKNSNATSIGYTNKSLVKVQYFGSPPGSYMIIAQKKGSTKITFTYQLTSGGTTKRSVNVKIFKKPVNPFKTIKIDGKNYKSKVLMRDFGLTFGAPYLTKKSKVKVQYKLKSGWTCSKISVKSGATLKADKDAFIVNATNKKTGMVVNVYVTIQKES